MAPPIRGSKTFWKLWNEGPTPTNEVDDVRYGDKRLYGVAKFGRTNAVTTSVYYLLGTHDRRDVVRKWIEINEQILREREPTTLSLQLIFSPEFRSAISEVSKDYDWIKEARGPTNTDITHECPYCGSTDIRDIPTHIRKGCPELEQ